MSDDRQTEENPRMRQLALESSLNPIALSDLDGEITYVNPAFMETWGHDDENEVLGRPATAFWATEGKAKEVLHALHETGRWFGEIIARRKDGTTFPVQTSASVVTNEDGEAVGMMASFVDLSEHARIRQALHETERKFRAIINNSPIGIALLDEDGELLLSNLALQDMLGYSEEKLQNLGLSDLTHPDDVEKDETLYQELHDEERTSYSIDKRFVRRDGSVMWGALTVAVIRNEENAPQNVICMVEDVTKEKRMEQERQQLLQDLKRSNEELEQFAYVASHDLQEPLRMVSSYLQLLQRRYQDELDEDADDFIVYAVDGARRMKQLINDLLKYSRITTRGNPFEPVDISGLMEEVVDDLQQQIAETDAAVTHEELPTITADKSQLRRLLQNLVSNAIKYRGDEPPEIHIGVREQQDAWRFAVADNGVGIPEEQQDRVFVIFQRLHGHDEGGGGTGIGLALCKRIVERHGGDIWVDSEPGEGATFYFTIPKDLKEKQGEKK